ncbi:MAG TPA: hypothetical protein VF476_00370 [Chitinophagaceae bacterium]
MTYESFKIELLKTQSESSLVGSFDKELIKEYQSLITDPDYFGFVIEMDNRGFFSSNSLQFYLYCESRDFRNIKTVNEVLAIEFEDLMKKFVSIGQDIFGNQFIVSIETGAFSFFNIESGEKVEMGKSFREFMEILVRGIDYYSGVSFLIEWGKQLELNERLYPIKPFVIGGQYQKDNFCKLEFPTYLSLYGDIARQISNLPNDTRVILKFK